MSWRAIEPRCGGRLTQTSGTITYYDVHDDDICAWYISVPPQYHIEITLKSAKMASGTAVNCTVNSLELFDHQSAANRTRLIEVCENQPKPLIFRTTVPYATVYFKTNRKLMENDVPVLDCKKDSSDPWCGVGFVLSYKTLELPTGCGGTITPDENGKMEGYIESPGYGHSYFPNLSCEWILNATVENSTLPVVESARKVQIEFIDFDIATSETKYSTSISRIAQRVIQNCGGDFVKVFPKGGMFCNLLPPKGVYSNSYFDIKLITDSSVGGRGFRLKYQNVTVTFVVTLLLLSSIQNQ
uniref:CUB domain-containing protein n=1 Tax=Panagrolaimus sp. ES5 TaxID=591445 RepID=A0AC34FU07_9BILA